MDSRNTIIWGIKKLPARYASVVVPLLLSIFMTGVVSLISTAKGFGLTHDLLTKWLGAWGLSWAIAFPTLFIVLPAVRKVTNRLVDSSSV